VLVEDEHALRAAFTAFAAACERLDPTLRRSYGDEALVEEYLRGRLLSAEVMVAAGRPTLLAIGERARAREDEAIELGTTCEASLDAAERRAVADYAAAVVVALGLDVGIFHVEIMLTADGPRLIECNPRLAGGSIPQLCRIATGVDPYEQLVHLCLGAAPTAQPADSGWCATSRALASRAAGRFAGGDLAWTAELGDTLVKLDLFVGPGDPIRRFASNHDYFGFLITRARTSSAAEAAADDALGRLAAATGLSLYGAA